jgi:two-component system alkaline phosphatase synthesis response regulator PhoP
MSGLEVCKRIRHAGSSLPIIILTVRGQEIDKVVGLRTGADNYVTKPFSFMELMARVEALMRRTGVSLRQPETADHYVFGKVSTNFARLEAQRQGQSIEMTPREFRILKYFVEHRGEIVTRDQLLDEVWSYNHAPLTRTVDVHIAKLRRKIEDDPENPVFLITIHGAGYKFLG